MLAGWGIELDVGSKRVTAVPRVSTGGKQRLGLGHPDQRRADDRAAHAERCSRAPETRGSMTIEIPPSSAQRGRRRWWSAWPTTLDCLRLREGVCRAGGELAVTYLNEKAKNYVAPLARRARRTDLRAARRRRAGRARGGVRQRIRSSGGGSTCWCTRSHWRRRRICRVGSSIVGRGLRHRRWTSRAIRSCEWRGRPLRSMKKGGSMFAMAITAPKSRAEL